MTEPSKAEIRKIFSQSSDFNRIFDAFKYSLQRREDDIELYRLLFWNKSLKPDELCMLGKKLASEFPQIAYDIYMWLANIFELTYFKEDNYERAMDYYKKAAEIKPFEPDPYLDACDCYEPDLNIPPADQLIDFLKSGTQKVSSPKALSLRLARIYSLIGKEDESIFYTNKANERDEK